LSPVAPRSTFAKTELDGMIQVLAPAASPERLQSILAACSDDPQLQSSAAALIAAGQYQEFITLVDASTTLPAACAADLRLMAEALASGQTAPPSSPVIQITVPPTDGTILTTQDDTHFQAMAYDSAVGTNDGGGIQRVEFEVYNPSGTLIHSHAETQAVFCAFGGNVPCNIAPSGLLGLPGTYTLKARAQSTGGTWTDWVSRTFVVSADTGTGLLGE
ncbi:MAG: DUF3324 domain-containing protein, partial [Anaerolineae bacterium]|nr:DUF3324 domain-containing protein [Anaerolineae bacterium]